MAEHFPTPVLATLNDEAKEQVMVDATVATERLIAGDAIATLDYAQLISLCIMREAELAAFYSEVQRRRDAMTN